MASVVRSVEAEYQRYRRLGEGAIGQLSDNELCRMTSGESNSVATLVWHIAGNLESRFTDFLAADGEKPWRDRESEFVPRNATRAEIMSKWEAGWHLLLSILRDLEDTQLERIVHIRAQPLTVCEALLRSLAHLSFHVGQIVYVAKSIRGASWEYLTIPPGQSSSYNLNPTKEKAPGDIK